MNVRKVKLGLWTLAGAMIAGAVVCAAWGIVAPVEVPEAVVSRSGMRPATQSSPEGRLGMDAFERIVAMKLRKAPEGSAVATTNPQMTTQATGGGGTPFSLVGTIGESLAMVQTSGGTIEVLRVGEQANGAKIVAIRPWQVDVEVGGARMRIAKPREGGGG